MWRRLSDGNTPYRAHSSCQIHTHSEETGIIIPIGEWVLKTACAINKAWQEGGCPGLKMAVNVSARQLQSVDFPGTVKKILRQTGLEPQYLELEINEEAIKKNVELCLDTIGRLREMGVGISMDGFGTGYSCFRHLRERDISLLKINQSLFSDLKGSNSDRIIVNSIISMAHQLGIEVTAEGVEEQEQLDVLGNMKCDYIQGYLLSRPLSQQDFEKLLKTRG